MDASMCLYQFLIAVRSEGSYQLTDEKGETTSHIIGMFYRTIRMLDNGLKPVYVFDGMLVQVFTLLFLLTANLPTMSNSTFL